MNNPSTFSPARKSIPMDIPTDLRNRLGEVGRRELSDGQFERMVDALEKYAAMVNIASNLAPVTDVRDYLQNLDAAAVKLRKCLSAGGKALDHDAIAETLVGRENLASLFLLLAQLHMKCEAALAELVPVDNRDFAGFTGFVIAVAEAFKEAGGKVTAQSNNTHRDTPFVAVIRQLLDCFPEHPIAPESRVTVHRKNLGKAVLDAILKYRENMA